MNNQQPGWHGIKAYRDMYTLWHRLSRPDQKVWIDFMEMIIEDWRIGNQVSFCIGFLAGACLFAIAIQWRLFG